MRWIVLAVALAGCGDVSAAGGVSPDGGPGAAGGAQMAGAGGGGSGGTGAPAGGASGGSMAGAPGGSGGAAAAPSCAIPIEQINGTDETATWARSNGCASQTGQRVQIVSGKVSNYFDAAEWAVDDYSIVLEPGTTALCDVSIRYTRTDLTCGLDRLFVTLHVSAI